jgi:hypothetical protein
MHAEQYTLPPSHTPALHFLLRQWTFITNKCMSQAGVAHACNPSYSGGRDQEDHGSKPAWGNKFLRPYLKNTHHQKGLVEGLKV